MPDFSGASLKLKVEGEDKVVAALDKIDKKAQSSAQMVSTVYGRSVSEAAAAFDALYGKQSRAAKQTQQVVEETATKVDAAMNRSARGVLAVSRGLEVMARTGKETGRSLDTLLSQVGYAAFGFGAQGALVGAIAIGTAAIVELFSRVGAEMDKLHAKYDRTTEELMRHGSLLSVDAKRQELFSGGFAIREKGESDASFIGRSGGIGGLATEAVRLNQQINAINSRPGLHFESDAKDVADLTDKLREVNQMIGVLGTQWTQLGQREKSELEVANRRAEIELDKKNERIKHRPVYGTTDPYRREENSSLTHFALDPAYAEMARLESTIPDPLKAFGDKLKADNEADAFQIKEAVDHSLAGIRSSFDKAKQEAEQRAQEIGNVIANGISSGIQAALSKNGGIAAGFKAMTDAIISGLGNMFAQVAEKALIGSSIMKSLVAAIQSMNPWVAAAAAVALLAFGNSLRGSGSAGGGSGGGGYGSSLPAINNTGVISAAAPQGTVTNPSSVQPRATQQNTFYVIGPDDPRAGRQIQQLLDNNARRG